MGAEGEPLKACLQDLQKCVKAGGLVPAPPLGLSCMPRLRQRLQDPGNLSGVSFDGYLNSLGSCMSEIEVMKDDTMHVSKGCMTTLKKCVSSDGLSTSGSPSNPFLSQQALELRAFIEGSGLLE
eukprot:TRINITY_DN2471_c1_g1_i1.p1 TRINITY_DN2471_c1_g1~~TRINITY_DN2471_c1_g1_i1.p1  ORF type:complete len:124 (+),score=19.17 TRINITY_DN2471_c1_g1_i1:244-615(+)